MTTPAHGKDQGMRDGRARDHMLARQRGGKKPAG